MIEARPFLVKIKYRKIHEACSTIHEVYRASQQFPTTSHSFQGSTTRVYTLDPPSKFRIIPCSLFFSLESLSLSIPLNPVRQSVPGEKRLSYFSRSQTYISFRLNALHDSYHSPLGVDLNLKFRHTFRNGDTKAKRDKGFTKYSCFLFFAKKKKKDISPPNKINRSRNRRIEGEHGRN